MRSALLLLPLLGCPGKTELLPREKLLDPETCADCHPDHFDEWEGSMHAYASEDPVFRALNAKGQEETGGELGDFCVQCHAPLAVAEGLTTDGLNLDEVEQKYHGVNCAFCHQVDAVEGTHNNPLKLAVDRAFRGSIKNPRDPGAHEALYSEYTDRGEPESAELCGSCHDIVTPLGAHIERTYSEWQTSVYAEESAGFGLTCGGCHMRGRDDVAADVDGVPLRRVHAHSFEGVDVALSDWPDREEQLALVQTALDNTVRAELCVGYAGGSTPIALTLENVAAGHAFPSGSSPDRRVWVELEALDGQGDVIWSKGKVGDDEAVAEVAAADPTMWTLHDTLLDAEGNKTHFFWEAADTQIDLLDPPGADQTDPFAHHQTRNFLVQGVEAAEVRMAVKMRALPMDLLDELVDEGRLDASVREAMPTFTLASTVIRWTPGAGQPNGDTTCVP